MKQSLLILFYLLGLIDLTAQDVMLDSIIDWHYPLSKKTTHTKTVLGEEFKDPYHWLESDDNIETKDWILAQKRYTDEYFDRYKKIRRNLEYKINFYQSIYVPHPIKRGDYYFSILVESEDELPSLYFQKIIGGQRTKILDVNSISKKDRIQLREFEVSKDSKYLSYSFSRNGRELQEIHVMSLPDGKLLTDSVSDYGYPDISWQRSGIAWKGNGFYYCRFGMPGVQTGDPNKDRAMYVYYHKLGDEEERDSLVYKRTNHPEFIFNIFSTSDERFLVLVEHNYEKKTYNVYYNDFNSPDLGLQGLVRNFKGSIRFLDNIGDELIALTDYKAENNWLVAMDPNNPLQWRALINKFDDALLMNAELVGDKIACLYQVGAQQNLMIFDYNNNVINSFNIGAGNHIGDLMGRKNDNYALLYFENIVSPPVYTLFDLKKNEFKYRVKINLYDKFYPDNFNIRKVNYPSKDGTLIPLTIVTHKSKYKPHKPHPTMLTAYGGYGIVVPPKYSPEVVYMLRSGGVYAFAHIRGGGDLGTNWHKAGRGINKVNSVDDFIGAAEYLIDNNYTTPKHLAISGASHGGFVVGSAMVKRPDLFGVAITNVGLLDLLNSSVNSNEFGSSMKAEEFEMRMNISPLSNLKNDVNYPAIMIMTSSLDERVAPYNSYKFTAALQNLKGMNNAVILRMEDDKGHFGALNYSGWVEQEADIYSFMYFNMGLKAK